MEGETERERETEGGVGTSVIRVLRLSSGVPGMENMSTKCLIGLRQGAERRERGESEGVCCGKCTGVV